MPITLEEAVKELEFIQSIGGVNVNNADHLQRIIDQFGVEAHEVFQEVAEDLQTLSATIAAEQTASSAVELT